MLVCMNMIPFLCIFRVFLRSIKRLYQFMAFSLFDIYQRFLFFYLLGLFVEELQGCMSSVMVEKD